jgi:putative transposase
MRNVITIGRCSKKEVVAENPTRLKMLEAINSRIELIQALIPLGLEAVSDLLQEEVRKLVGERYERNKESAGRVRWGKQKSSIYLSDQKLSVLVPRIRDRRINAEIPLMSLEALQSPRHLDEGLFQKVLSGLSCRNYRECAEAVPQAFGLSASTVSRRYIRASARKLENLLNRRLEAYDFVAILMDGKHFADDEIVICLGVTFQGEKIVLGLIQTATENEKSCSEFLAELLDRGLKSEEGLLVVIDGGKGLKKAVEKVLGDKAVVQRCQWHKRENVKSYLSKSEQAVMSKKLQAAYEQPTYEKARESLLRIKSELKEKNLSAMKSLEEGLEETLTLHRLGVFPKLGISLKTTNLIESMNAGLGQRTDKVDRWRNSDQKQRWVASALLDIEKGFRRIKGYRYLPLLKEALKKTVMERESQKMKRAA